LASQQHQHEAINLQQEVGISTTSARSWKSSSRGWHHNNINMKLEIFITRLESQKHHHEAGNIQHEVGMNISTKLEIFSTRLESQQHKHGDRNI
jgi:hypothetical protein